MYKFYSVYMQYTLAIPALYRVYTHAHAHLYQMACIRYTCMLCCYITCVKLFVQACIFIQYNYLSLKLLS